MKFIDGKNTRSDVQRVIRHIVQSVLLIGFGFLLSYFVYGEKSIQNDDSNNSSTGINYQILCQPDVIVKLYQLPSENPKTGIE